MTAPDLYRSPHSPGRLVYMVALEMIFIPLAKWKAACRNQASNWFLMIVVNLLNHPDDQNYPNHHNAFTTRIFKY